MPSLATPRPLLRAIKKQVGKVRVSLRSQGEALEELFQLFTSERRHLKRFSYMNDPRLRLAYLRYHLPLNTVRSICVLKDLLVRYPAIGSRMDNRYRCRAGQLDHREPADPGPRPYETLPAYRPEPQRPASRPGDLRRVRPA